MDGTMISTVLARYIKDQRLKKSWTQAQLAIIAGLSERTIQRIYDVLTTDNGNTHAATATWDNATQANVNIVKDLLTAKKLIMEKKPSVKPRQATMSVVIHLAKRGAVFWYLCTVLAR